MPGTSTRCCGEGFRPQGKDEGELATLRFAPHQVHGEVDSGEDFSAEDQNPILLRRHDGNLALEYPGRGLLDSCWKKDRRI